MTDSAAVRRVLEALERGGFRPRRQGDGHTARCPVHGGDDWDSLTVTTGPDGRALVRCHTRRCPFPDIMRAVGLSQRDAFPDRQAPSPRRRPRHDDGEPVAPVPADAPTPPDQHPKLGRPVARWAYRDDRGRVLMYVCRFDSARPDDKEIRPLSLWRIGERLVWRWKTLPRPRPLYALDLLAEQPDAPVLVTEGEKAADAAARLFPDHVATTSPGGSDGVKVADWTQLRGRDVVVWPDNDEPGRRYAADVARLARAAGAASVRVVEVPGV